MSLSIVEQTKTRSSGFNIFENQIAQVGISFCYIPLTTAACG
jgi:hypothetical protein